MGNYTTLTDIVFVRRDAKRGPRSTMALDRRWFFQVTAELQKDANRQLCQHFNTQLVRCLCCIQHTDVYVRVFFAFRPNALSFFW